MADLIPPMIVTIEARVGQLESQMKAATDSVNKFGVAAKSNSGATATLSGSFKTLAGSIGGLLALRQVSQFLDEATRAAVEDNKSQALLARQLVATTGATKDQIAATEDAIKTMSLQSGVVDDKIRPAMSTLTRATGSLTEATKLTSLAMDVSAGTGRSVEAVALALAKAHNGNTGALQRLGISVKGVSDPMAYLAEQFDGAAKTAANTDPYSRMTVALDVIKESIGRALLPMLVKFADWLTGMAPKIEDFFKQLTDPTTEAGKKWQAFTDGLMNAFDWIVKNGQKIAEFTGFFLAFRVAIALATGGMALYAAATTAATGATIGMNAAMAATPWGAVAAGLAVIATGLVAVYNKAYDAKDAWAKMRAEITSENITSNAGSVLAQGLEKVDVTPIQQMLLKQKYGSGQPGAWSTSYAAAKTPEETAKRMADSFMKSGTISGSKVDPFVTYLKNTQKQILAARDTYDKAVKAANDKYGAMIQQAQDTMASLIEQSMGRLKSAFATAVATDVGTMWKDLAAEGMGSASTLLSNLQNRLTNIKKLAANAAALAGKGYSQTFIEQVVAQGPDVGNQMAEALKEASPETAKSLQDLFRQTEVVTNSGMDSLARQLYDKSGLATDELKKLYKTAQDQMIEAQKDLATALATAANTLNDSLGTIEAEFSAKLLSMQGSLSKFKTQIGDIRNLLGSSAAPAPQGLTFGLNAAGEMVTYDANGNPIANPSSDIAFGGAQTSKAIVFNQTNNSNASPEQIAVNTVNAIKFGLAVV